MYILFVRLIEDYRVNGNYLYFEYKLENSRSMIF